MSTDEDGGGKAGGAAVGERIVSFLRTVDRPRQAASDVAAALDLTRGEVRTGLQRLADAERVVRVDEGPTARWATPDRAHEPDPGPERRGERSEPGADTEGDASAEAGGKAKTATESDAGGGDATGASGEPTHEPTDERSVEALPVRSSPETRSRGIGDGGSRSGRSAIRAAALFVGLVVAGAALRRRRR